MKGLLLISGGIDSAVTARIMKDNNILLEAVHFSQEPFTDASPEEKAKEVCNKLNIKLHIINLSKELEHISKTCQHKFYFILLKRLMHKKAEELAKKIKADFLVNGENLGQVSSQTLDNLKVIDKAVNMTILRPLLTYDKDEIIKKAKEFNLYDIATGPEMCDVLGPKHPATKTNIEIIEEEECKL